MEEETVLAAHRSRPVQVCQPVTGGLLAHSRRCLLQACDAAAETLRPR